MPNIDDMDRTQLIELIYSIKAQLELKEKQFDEIQKELNKYKKCTCLAKK